MGESRGAEALEENGAGSDAGTGDRTRMSFRTQDFKSRASASFAIPARGPLTKNGGASAPPFFILSPHLNRERETGLEPATPTLARLCSTN